MRAMKLGVVVACVVLASQAQANLLLNHSFEDALTSWSAWGGQTTTDEFYGMNPEEGLSFLRQWYQSGVFQDFTVEVGSTYTFAAWVASAAGDGLWGDANGFVKWEWRDKSSGDDPVGTAVEQTFNTGGGFNVTINSDQWTQIDLGTFIAPAGATHGRVVVGMWTAGGITGGGNALYDNLSALQVIPEPATLALSALGLGLIGLVRRKRAR